MKAMINDLSAKQSSRSFSKNEPEASHEKGEKMPSVEGSVFSLATVVSSV